MNEVLPLKKTQKTVVKKRNQVSKTAKYSESSSCSRYPFLKRVSGSPTFLANKKKRFFLCGWVDKKIIFRFRVIENRANVFGKPITLPLLSPPPFQQNRKLKNNSLLVRFDRWSLKERLYSNKKIFEICEP